MEKKKISVFNEQLSRMYSLSILHIILSVIGLSLFYFNINNQYIYFIIILFNIIALFYFEPWKIMGYLNEGYSYQKELEAPKGSK